MYTKNEFKKYLKNPRETVRWKPKFEDIVEPYYELLDSNDTTLIFESRFESGNLGLEIGRAHV